MATMATTITIDLDDEDLAVLDAAIEALAASHDIAASRAELVMVAITMIREGLNRPGSWEGEYIAATLDLEREALARLLPREDSAPSAPPESSARGNVIPFRASRAERGLVARIAPDEPEAREDPAQIASARTAHRARNESGPHAMSTLRCHDTAHDVGTAAACDPIEASCVALCEAAAGDGGGHDEDGGHD